MSRTWLRPKGRQLRLALLLLVVSWLPGPALAQDDTELAKKTQNPVADLISVPLQNNINFGVGPNDDVQYILNVQPVIPFWLTEDWNLISRTIMPLIYQPELAPGVGDRAGSARNGRADGGRVMRGASHEPGLEDARCHAGEPDTEDCT